MVTIALAGLLLQVAPIPMVVAPRVALAQASGSTSLVTVNPADGSDSTRESYLRDVTPDGRYVLIRGSGSTNYYCACPHGAYELYLYDRDTGIYDHVSSDASGNKGDGLNFHGSVSDDGRFVAFSSTSTDLVAGDSNGEEDVFVKDRQTGATMRVSVSSGGGQANGESDFPVISGDGDHVVFESNASNLVTSDTNGTTQDVFVHEVTTGTTTLDSVNNSGSQLTTTAYRPDISADGRFVSFDGLAQYTAGSGWAGWDEADDDHVEDVFVRDRSAGTTELVSLNDPFDGGDVRAVQGKVSADGRFVAYMALVSGTFQAYRYDRGTGVTRSASVDSSGQPGGEHSMYPSISADGRAVAFESDSALVASDTNSRKDTYVFDFQSNGLERVSLTPENTELTIDAYSAMLSGDSRYVLFDSQGAFAPPDGESSSFNDWDVFSHDRGEQPPRVLPLVGVPLTRGELYGGSSGALVGECPCRSERGGSVNTLFGNEHFELPGIALAGRGPAVGFGLSYNSLAAAQDGTTGHGWSHDVDMSLLPDGTDSYVLIQESGATVTFTSDGIGGWMPLGRMSATLEVHGDGSATVVRRKREVFEFDPTGRLVELSDLNGETASYTYLTSGELESVTNASGRSLIFGWANGRIATVSDSRAGADGGPRSVSLSYDASGDLVSFTDVGGGSWSLGYDANHLLVSAESPRDATGAGWEWTYDSQGRVVWEEDELDRRREFHYDDPVWGATRVVEPDGSQSVDWYNDLGQRIKVTEGYGTAEEASTLFEYDPVTFMVTKATSPDGHETLYDYGDPANPWSATMVTDPLLRTMETSYNGLGQPTQVVDNAGVVTNSVYDSAGNVELLTVAAGTPDEAVTDFVYGNPAHPGDLTSLVDPNGHTWSTSYDSTTGDVLSSTDPEGNTTTLSYNSLGWITSSVSPRGNEAGATPADFTTEFTYTDFGDVDTVTDPEGAVVDTDFDAEGYPVSVTHADGVVDTMTYNAAGEQTVVTRASGSADEALTTYTYTPAGLLESWSRQGSGTWSYSYDALHRLASETDPNANVTAYDYDLDSRLVQTQLPGGDCNAGTPVRCVNYSYDSAGQLTSVDYADPETVDLTSIGYDDAGRRSTVTRSDGGSEAWSWTDRGQLESQTDATGATVGYTYLPGGETDTISYPGSAGTVTYGYDDAGRMDSVTDWLGNTTTFGWDANSNLSGRTSPTNTASFTDSRTYDGADRLDTIDWSNNSSPVAAIDYSRSLDGLITGIAETALPDGPAGFGYNNRDELDTIDAATRTIDTAGNITQLEDGRLQVFDPAQQLCWTSPTTTGSCASPPPDATVHSYDNRGNRLSSTAPDGSESSYSYDDANRLVEAHVQDHGGSSFQRVNETVVNTTPSARTGLCPTSTVECTTLNGTNGRTRLVQVAGVGALPDAEDIEAVLVNMAIITTDTCSGCEQSLTLYDPSLAVVPDPNVRFQSGQATSAGLIVPLDDQGRVAVTTDADADVGIVVRGYFSATAPDADGYQSITPVRAAYNGSGDCLPVACSRLGNNGTPLYRDIKVTGVGDVPTDGTVTEVAVNITVTQASANGALYIGPTGGAFTSATSFSAADAGSDFAVVPVGTDGRIRVHSTAAGLSVSVEVVGYFTGPSDTAAGYRSLPAPEPLLDNPAAQPCTTGTVCATIGAGQTITIPVEDVGAIPDRDVDTVLVTITTEQTSFQYPFNYLTVWPTGEAQPGVANVLHDSNDLASTTTSVAVGVDGTISLYSVTDATISIDATGYFASTDTIDYRYDSSGLRESKTSSHAGERTYTWNTAGPLPLLLTETSPTGANHIIYGPGRLPIAQINPDNTTHWLWGDHLASTRLTTNHDGTVKASFTYKPNGQIANRTGTTTPILTYAGEHTDPATGHIYLRARYYDPTTNQFLTRDPIVDVTFEPHAYASNDSVNNVDPTGRNKCEVGANPLRWVGNAVDCVSKYDEAEYSVRACPVIGCFDLVYDAATNDFDSNGGFGPAFYLGAAYDPTPNPEKSDPRYTASAEAFCSIGPVGISTDGGLSIGPSKHSFGGGFVLWAW